MGNSESATSDEEDMANDLAMEESNEVIKVFQPRKLRDELENGKNFVRDHASINDVGNFSGFLTPLSPMSAVF
jgi:hypothetical protein